MECEAVRPGKSLVVSAHRTASVFKFSRTWRRNIHMKRKLTRLAHYMAPQTL